MRRLLGIVMVCLVLVVLMGTSSRAEFRVEEISTGLHQVTANNGFFATNRSLDVVLSNATGAFLPGGTVVVPDLTAVTCPPGTFCVKPAPTGEKTRVIGVVDVEADTGQPVSVAVAGIAVVNITGTVNAGDLLRVSSTTAGRAETASSGELGVFAVALDYGMDDWVWCAFTKQELY